MSWWFYGLLAVTIVAAVAVIGYGLAASPREDFDADD